MQLLMLPAMALCSNSSILSLCVYYTYIECGRQSSAFEGIFLGYMQPCTGCNVVRMEGM